MLLNYANFSTTLASTITAAAPTIPVAAAGGFPAAPFCIAVDRGNTSQEVMLVTAVSGTTLTVTRNFDGAGAYAHTAPATVEVTAPASDLQAFNTHATGSHDDHLNLMDTAGTRHDLMARHLMGTSLPASSAPPSNSALGDVASDGVGPTLAYADHIHGRESYASYTSLLLIPGMVFPGLPTDHRLLAANGTWVNQSDFPTLYLAIGQRYAPTAATTTLATSPFNATVHFALPSMGTWSSGVFTWSYATPWVIVASST